MLYSLLLYFVFPLVIFRLFWRSRLNPAYRQRIPERLGLVRRDNDDSDKPHIWLHAVSVGEVIAAKPFIDALIQSYPKYRILVTTTTPTGSERVKALFANRVAHVYFPYDLPEIVIRFVNRIKPSLLIVIETEIWPNLYALCHKKNIPLLLANARLSDRSTSSYLKIKSLVKETLSNINMIAVRSSADALRFEKLGASDEQISIVGNIKFDYSVDQQQLAQGKQWKNDWQSTHKEKCFIWVAASTHAGEDEQILAIYQSLLHQFPSLMLVLIPRHPERFNDVFLLCEALKDKGIKTLRHSQVEDYKDSQAHIILGDSMGEMQSWFATADVVFMGGSLVKTGGHNPLEAIAQGVPVVSGSHMFNFDDISTLLSDEELLFICESKADIEKRISSLLSKNDKQQGFEYKAEVFLQQHRGVTARLLKHVSTLLDTKTGN